ncbi:MAG: methyltransferase domain-containing protein [Sphingomonadales bacterium]|nr:methyltransferase domain-containing protein [Sphingomonadales bacterium]
MGPHLLQPWPVTAFDRHPALFAFARQELAGRPSPSLLSYGCSTGEEPLTLAHYIPSATITAIDINARSIAKARRRAVEAGLDRVTFQVGATAPVPCRQFDAIFCLSVLRHGELDAIIPADCEEILPFSSFARMVAALDGCLRDGGLLFIWGSNFDFRDLPLACRYELVSLPSVPPHPGPVYGPDNRLKHQEGLDCFVFRKKPATPG